MADKEADPISFARTPALERCENMVRRSLQSPAVKLFLQRMKESGCPVSDNFIMAANCGGPLADTYGVYLFGLGIFICSNHKTSQAFLNETVIHELIHAYDQCRACTEIRAVNLSGDCHYKRELLEGNLGFSNFRGHGQECVKRKVLATLKRKANCAGIAKDCMEVVWDICYNDTKPFDKAP